MTKRQARWFFLVCTFGFAAIFIALTIHSHTRFPELTNADQLSPDVVAGKDVWHANNCINCHTLFGEGAYYAPDLTKITDHRGTEYLKAFLRDPSAFYSEEKHRRVMPNPELTEEEVTQVIAFLEWVSKVDNQNWPPRPILVSGGTFPGTAVAPDVDPTEGAEGLSSTAAEGEALFRQSPPACFTCHSTAPGVNLAGPTLAGIGTRAAQVIEDPNYTGNAQTPEEYLVESILEPSAYLVPGEIYGANGMSFMPNNYSDQLTEEQVQLLVDYMMTLK